MLREFSLRDGRNGNVRSKHNRARGCGALIDGQHIGHDIFLALLPGMLAVRCCGKASGLAGEGQYGSCPGCCAALLRCAADRGPWVHKASVGSGSAEQGEERWSASGTGE